MVKINKDIVPISYSDSGMHPERKFEEKIRHFLSSYHIKETQSSVVHTEFTVFDLLIFPQHSPVRTSRNVIYLSHELRSEDQTDAGFYEKVSQAHKNRFGSNLDPNVSSRRMLLSHTTASIAENLIKEGPQEIFVLSKVFRNKPERKEKTQLEIALCDRTLPEIISFVENLYSFVLGKDVSVSLDSNFFYFCEPSFSIKASTDSKNHRLGAGGFMREELLTEINNRHSQSVKNIAYIGISYQKLLNLYLGLPPNKYDVDYNSY